MNEAETRPPRRTHEASACPPAGRSVLFQEPDKLRWEIQTPFQSILVVAGEDVAKFEFVRGEKRALQLGRGKNPLLLVMS